MRTVLVATTFPTGRSSGSLHVFAGSPFLAAWRQLMSTVVLPLITVPLLLGALSGGGVCAGVLVAVLCSVAACSCSTSTLGLRLPSRMPEKGIGVGTPC